MIKEEIESYLDYDNEFIKSIARQAVQIDEDFKANKLSKSEHQELLKDLASQKDVQASMKDLAVKESLNKLINNLITVASAL